MPIKVEKINVNLFLDTIQITKIGMNEMRMNDDEISMRWSDRARSIPEISVQRGPR